MSNFQAKHELYPVIQARRMILHALRIWTSRGLIGAFVVCAIVNLCVGGRPWILLVLLGEYILYLLFLYKEPIESSLLEQFTPIVYAVCGILLVANWWGSDSVEIALPMTYFGMLCGSFVLYLLEYRLYHRNLLPLAHCLLFAVFNALIGLALPWGLNWPRIVLLSTSGFMVLVLVVLLRKTFWIECKKRFSTK